MMRKNRVVLSAVIFSVVCAVMLVTICIVFSRSHISEPEAFWVPIPYIEPSKLRVHDVVLQYNTCRRQGVSVRGSTWHDVHGIWSQLEAVENSPWPPLGTIQVHFRDLQTNTKVKISIRSSDWDESRSFRSLIFPKDCIACIQRQDDDVIDAIANSVLMSDLRPEQPKSPLMISEDGESHLIPWRLVQSYRLPFLTSNMHTAHLTFISMNPGIESHFYGNRSMRNFVEKHFDLRTLSALDKLGPGAFKCDLFRLCELYVYGGVYADVSMVCLASLHSLMANVDMVLVRDTPTRDLSYIYNAFFATVARSPFILFAIRESVERVMAEDMSRDALSVTGPGIFGRGLNRFVGRPETSAHPLGVGMYGTMRVRMLENGSGRVIDTERGLPVLQCKYKDWCSDRPGNPHCGKLWKDGKVFLQELEPELCNTAVSALRVEENIPRMMLQTWESVYMASGMLHNVRKMKRVHSRAGWGNRFADDFQRRRDVVEFGDSRTVRAFDRILGGGARAHFWAVVCLSASGGVYCDSHTMVRKSLDAILRRDDQVVLSARRRNGGDICGFIWACRKGHPLFAAVLEEAVVSILEDRDRSTSSSYWFKRTQAKHPALWIDVRVVCAKGGHLFSTSRACGRGRRGRESREIVASERYVGYNTERVTLGGESPKELQILKQVIVPYFPVDTN